MSHLSHLYTEEELQKYIIKFYKNGYEYLYDTRLHDDEVAGHKVKMTSFYTVIDPNWSVEYILDVQEAERQVGRAICGAPKKDGTPCRMIPITLDEEPYPEEIGRCHLHRPSMAREDVEYADDEAIGPDATTTAVVRSESRAPAIADTGVNLPDTPVVKTIQGIAEEHYMRCQACVHRKTCELAGQNNGRCIKEKRIFEDMLMLMINENQLETVSDIVTAYTIVDTMLKLIRSSSYEASYGQIESISSGNAHYNIKLKQLLYQGLKSLGIDRRTRISIRRHDGSVERFEGSIAKALSNVDIKEVEMKTARLKVEKKKVMSSVGRTGPPIGLDGRVIEDDKPIQI